MRVCCHRRVVANARNASGTTSTPSVSYRNACRKPLDSAWRCVLGMCRGRTRPPAKLTRTRLPASGPSGGPGRRRATSSAASHRWVPASAVAVVRRTRRDTAQAQPRRLRLWVASWELAAYPTWRAISARLAGLTRSAMPRHSRTREQPAPQGPRLPRRRPRRPRRSSCSEGVSSLRRVPPRSNTRVGRTPLCTRGTEPCTYAGDMACLTKASSSWAQLTWTSSM